MVKVARYALPVATSFSIVKREAPLSFFARKMTLRYTRMVKAQATYIQIAKLSINSISTVMSVLAGTFPLYHL